MSRPNSSSQGRPATFATWTSARRRLRGQDRRPASIDCRCQTRAVVAARKLGVITAYVGVALSLSMTHKAIGFDRRMPEIDFDTLDLPATHALPIGVEGAARYSGARNRQQPRRPLGRE